MHARAFVSAAIALALGVGLATPSHGLSLADAKCRRGLGKGVRLLADKVIKETTKCHRLRMQNRLPAVDCNDLVQIPGAVKVSRAEQKLAFLAGSQCAGATSPQELGYVVCPTPCEGIAITDYASVAACLTCVAEDRAVDAVVTTYNTPTLPVSTTDTICQNKIGLGLRKYFVTKVKEQQKCQYPEDQTPTMTNCRAADPTGKVNRALLRARLFVADCDVSSLVTLNTCADDVTAAQMCVQGVADADTDDLFTAVYDALDGIFVSTTATGTEDGTILHPFDTISEGINLAVSSGTTNVFVDGGAYTESLTLQSGVNIIGGFNSGSGWRRDGSLTQVFGGTTAVTGSSVTDVVIDGLKITAAANTAPGGSSYGIRLISPTNVLIKNGSVTAGNGGPGTGGSNGSTGASGTTGGNGGNGCENSTVFCSSCSRPAGGGGGSSSCGITGGGGGQPGRCDNEAAESGGSGGGAGGGAGGTSGGQCESAVGGTGQPGSPGAAGSDGAAGAAFGSAGATYSVAGGGNGGLGSNGGAGGGGGGGSGGGSSFGSCDSYGGAGGGGGGGGCRGTAATGGTGAGGSFGVWVAGGTLTLDTMDINTGNGGTGGNAGAGGAGGSGGSGGTAGGAGPQNARAGGGGGSGGAGGRGGHGGGGGGGPTVGIVCASGGLAAQNSVTVNLGTSGAGGSSVGNPGNSGLAAASNGC